MHKTWLITGGLGFIGRNLCEKIEKVYPDDKIIVVDKASPYYYCSEGTYKKSIRYGVDILDYQRLEEIFEMERPNYVIHLAAITNVRRSLQNPYETYQENINGTLNCVDISYRKAVENFIFASSCGVSGDVKQASEESIVNPESPYANSKAIGESLCMSYAKMGKDFCVNALRLSNVYGKHSLEKDSVIPKFIKNILNKTDIVINGDGEQTRDFVCVEDIARVIIEVIKKKRTDTFCISSFQKTSINKIIEILLKHSDNSEYNTNVKRQDSIKGEITDSLVNNSKIKNAIGFNFNTNIEDNIIDLFNWFKEEMKGIKIV